MKKLFLTLAAVSALTFAANAQTEKGKVTLGGQVGFGISDVKDTDIKNNSFSINPTVGYFVADNIEVGTSVGYAWAENKVTAAKNTKNEFQVAPYARMYSGNGPLKFFGQLSVPMSWGKNTAETTVANASTKVDSKYTNYGVQLAPGLAFFPTSNVAISLSVQGLYYNNHKNKATDVTTNTFGLDANSLNPTLGVKFHF